MQHGVAAKVYYPEALNRLALFPNSDHCPAADELAATVLSLPIRPDLSDDDVARVIDACRSF
jgi:dTDP-4-amino-4,6-dideoxygalactose transaminase